MGQKINPISLRLHSTNRHFDNCWYSNSFYKNLVNKDILLHHYLNNFLKLLKLPTGRYSIQHLQKKTQIFSFFCSSKSTRQWRSKLFGLAPNTKFLKKTRYFFKNKTQFKRKRKKYTKFHSFYNTVNQGAIFKLEKRITSFQNFQLWATLQKPTLFEKKQLFLGCHTGFSLPTKAFHTITPKFFNLSLYLSPKSRVFRKDFFQQGVLFENSHQSSLKKKKAQDKQHKNIDLLDFKEDSCFLKRETHSSHLFFQNLLLYKILKSQGKGKKQFQLISKCFLNRQIDVPQKLAFNTLESKYKNYLESSLSRLYDVELNFLPFRVKNDWQHAPYLADELVYFLEKRIAFRRLKKKILKQLSKIPTIRGVRITCSGRVGGKSKKAQRAKTECIKYGQTSLQVFSSKIDFSMKTAFTSFGSVGVKVWICYY